MQLFLSNFSTVKTQVLIIYAQNPYGDDDDYPDESAESGIS